ncbi:MAG: Hint domain-containing protein [Pseudomonadota bacterium]
MVTITSQSFEEETAVTAQNQYSFVTPDSGSIDLLNVAPDPLGLQGGIVNSTGANTGLGFSADWTSTRNGASNTDGLEDGDSIGVVTTDGTDGLPAFSDGSQGYVIDDSDGEFELTFDVVDLTSYENNMVSIDYYVRDAAYEPNDSFSISVLQDGVEAELLDLDGDELTAILPGWNTLTLQVADTVDEIQVVVEADFNAGLEEVYIDNLVVEGDLICFTPGTKIDTPQGPRAIETLAVGDAVIGADGAAHVLRWIGSTTIAPRPEQMPVRIKAGSWLGNTGDLCVSPAHRMLVRDWRAEALFGVPEVLVAAQDLVNGETILREDVAQVSYWHLLLDGHEMVQAEGCLSESLDPSSAALDNMGQAARDEILALFPMLEQGVGPAHVALSRAEAATLI